MKISLGSWKNRLNMNSTLIYYIYIYIYIYIYRERERERERNNGWLFWESKESHELDLKSVGQLQISWKLKQVIDI